MSDKLHENSDFVVCRACNRYFYFGEISEHQTTCHIDHEYRTEHDPYRRFYYLTNNEVVYYLNKRQDTQEAVRQLSVLLMS